MPKYTRLKEKPIYQHQSCTQDNPSTPTSSFFGRNNNVQVHFQLDWLSSLPVFGRVRKLCNQRTPLQQTATMPGKYGNRFSIIWNVWGTAGRTPVGNGWVIFETQNNRSQALLTQPLLHAFHHQQLKVYWSALTKKQQTRIRWAFWGFLFSKTQSNPVKISSQIWTVANSTISQICEKVL